MKKLGNLLLSNDPFQEIVMGNTALVRAIESEGISDSCVELVNNNNPKRGIITMGMPFLSLLDVLLQVDSPPDILKLGMTYPLPKQKILNFLKDHEEIKILEELDSEIELMIKAMKEDDIKVGDIGCHTLGHLPP
jgi:indolepyruvate ferredoxin oxidoreductase, alpha subunit